MRGSYVDVARCALARQSPPARTRGSRAVIPSGVVGFGPRAERCRRLRSLIAALIGVSAILLALATGSATAGSRAAAATACPGKLFEMTAGGRLDTEIRDHDEGPETEAFLCSAEGGRPFRIEGPLGSGFSLGVSGLAFAGKQAALAFEIRLDRGA